MARTNGTMGDEGSKQGQIQTPMCSENVGNKGGGSTHSFADVVGKMSGGGGKSDIKGPGSEGSWKKSK